MTNQVAEKMSLIEQYKMERERQQKVHDLKRHDFMMMVSVILLNDILILPFWFAVARRRRSKKVEKRARSESTAHALF